MKSVNCDKKDRSDFKTVISDTNYQRTYDFNILLLPLLSVHDHHCCFRFSWALATLYVFMVMQIKLAVIFVVVAVINWSSAISYQHNYVHQHSACNRRDNHRRKRLADLHKDVHSCSTNCFDIHQSLKSEFEIFRTLKERGNLVQNLRNLNEL